MQRGRYADGVFLVRAPPLPMSSHTSSNSALTSFTQFEVVFHVSLKPVSKLRQFSPVQFRHFVFQLIGQAHCLKAYQHSDRDSISRTPVTPVCRRSVCLMRPQEEE